MNDPVTLSINMNVMAAVQVAAPLVWQGMKEPDTTGLLAAAAEVIDPDSLTVQRDSEGEFVLFRPWLYNIKSRKWEGERQPERGGWAKSIRVPLSSYHLTEDLPSTDFLGRKPPAQNLLNVNAITSAMTRAFQQDPTQFVLEAFAANQLTGYDGQPTFHNNHAEITGKSGLTNIATLGADLPPRIDVNKPTKAEMYEEILILRRRLVTNRRGLLRFQNADAVRNLTVIVRSEDTFLALDRLNRDEKIDANQENNLRGTLTLVEDTEFGDYGIDGRTYDIITGDADSPKPYALSIVRPPLGIQVENEHFKQKLVYFGTDYDSAMGPWYWQGCYRVKP